MKEMPANKWPAGGLEEVLHCPLCASERRTLLHRDVADWFFGAPGRWTYWTCDSCRSSWLDPRPDERTIGEAYRQYYTHEAEDVSALFSTGFRLKLRNGYRNWRFGSRIEPSHILGRWAGRFIRSVREETEDYFRYLPRKRASDAPCILDYGCGNGNFLRAASEIGWTGFGVEPDPESRRIAASFGFPVFATLEEIAQNGGQFDAATLSHVIEHVHRPKDVLRSISAILKPGGFLYIATPNIEAVGHRLYGRYWRGLEPPRHLVIFNHSSMSRLLSDCGFEDIRYHRAGDVLSFTAEESRRVATTDDPRLPPTPSRKDRGIADGPGEHAEFLVLTARLATKFRK